MSFREKRHEIEFLARGGVFKPFQKAAIDFENPLSIFKDLLVARGPSLGFPKSHDYRTIISGKSNLVDFGNASEFPPLHLA